MSTSQPAVDTDFIQSEIIRILQELVSWDTGFAGSIGPATSLMRDLGMESIEVVQLAVKIEESFNSRLPFHKLVMTDDGRYVSDLTVADIVGFLRQELTQAAASGGG